MQKKIVITGGEGRFAQVLKRDNKKLDIENYFFKNPTTFSKYVDGINKVYRESFNL